MEENRIERTYLMLQDRAQQGEDVETRAERRREERGKPRNT